MQHSHAWFGVRPAAVPACTWGSAAHVWNRGRERAGRVGVWLVRGDSGTSVYKMHRESEVSMVSPVPYLIQAACRHRRKSQECIEREQACRQTAKLNFGVS